MTTELVDEETIPDGVVVVPLVPNSAQTDVPPEGATSNLLVNTPPDPQGDHTRSMDKLKLTFAVWVVLISFFVVVGLSVTQFVNQKELEPGSLNSAIDWAKSIAMMALGFALGRSIEESKSEAK